MNEAKSPDTSETTMTEVVCPNDTNPMGMLQGGRLVQWMDIAAAICAQRHAEQICVTSFIDGMKFLTSARVGDVITIKARMTRAFRTSMEISVKAWSKNLQSKEPALINEAHFTFVAISAAGKPAEVPLLTPASEDDEEAYLQAGKRKEALLKQKI